MDDVTAKTTPAVVMSSTPDNIASSSKQTLATKNITRIGLDQCSTCRASFCIYDSLNHISQSAKNGFIQCAAAEKGIRLACRKFFGGIDHPTPFDDSLWLLPPSGGDVLGQCFRVFGPDCTGVEKTIHIELIQLGSAGKDRLRLPAFMQYDRLPEATVGDVTYEIIRNWISACVNRNVLPGIKGLLPFEHSRCDKNDFKPLPKRVLSLQDKKVRLVEVDEGDWGKYACLSYCWGSAKFLRTSTSNLQQHKKGISMQDMPRLFSDVVEVCFKLSIPYLWIDALCIIQDSDTDWAEQASKMAEIYGNSFITIAATAAQDPRSSLFERDPPPTEFFTIPHETHHDFVFTARTAMKHPRRGEDRGASSYLLQRRGWVLQEDCLPPRTLHFLSGEVALACCAGMMCECSDAIFRWKDTWKEDEARVNCTSPKIFPANRSPGGRTEIDIIQSWHSIVSMYTSTSLTRESDKLPALSGLAKAMLGNERKDEYFAGLWKSSLKYDLLWRLSSSAVLKPKPYRAPSWSWASVDGTVIFERTFHYEPSDRSCKILEIRCTASTMDEFGQVRDGNLLLEGKLLRGTLEHEPSANRLYTEYKWRDPEWKPSCNTAWVRHNGTSFSFDMDHSLSEYGISEGTELELLCLCDCGRDAQSRVLLLGLVLYQRTGHDQYRERVGIWSASFEQGEEALLWEVFGKPNRQRVEIR